MRPCELCHQKNDRPRATTCKKCQKKWLLTYQRDYRTKNKELVRERIKNSHAKKPEYYKQLHFKHYVKRHGFPVDHIAKKKAKPGEGNINCQGYRRISKKNHPNAQASGIILEHIYVMSEYLGRPLFNGETVHHKNGNRLDNRLDNLELWSKSHPPGQRVEDKIKWCIAFLKQYGYTISDGAACSKTLR